VSADLDRRLQDLAGPPAELDVANLRESAHRARVRRGLVMTAAAVALLVPVGLGLRAARAPDVALTDPSGSTPAGLLPFDARTQVQGEVPALDDEAARREPTLLPPGLARCEGPAAQGVTVVTAYCDGTTVVARLARGPHDALPEVGDEIAVDDRAGYSTLGRERREVTVSDEDSPADTHYRLTAPKGYRAETLAEILASVPALRELLE